MPFNFLVYNSNQKCNVAWELNVGSLNNIVTHSIGHLLKIDSVLRAGIAGTIKGRATREQPCVAGLDNNNKWNLKDVESE